MNWWVVGFRVGGMVVGDGDCWSGVERVSVHHSHYYIGIIIR